MPSSVIKRNNVTITGKLSGARTIVFVHGIGTDQSAWQDVAKQFMTDFRVVLLDNVGAGHSDPEAFIHSRYLNLKGYATDLLEVCLALQLRDVILVGHSAGAMIGLLAAVDRPDIFSRLVLISASPRYIDEEGYRGGFSMKDINAIYDSIAREYSSWADQFAPMMMANTDQPRLVTRFSDSLKRIPAERALTVFCSILQSDHRHAVRQLKRPTLIIQSQNDNAVPREVAEYLHASITGSQLKIIDTEGHLPHISAPEKVIEAMKEFVCA